MPPFFVPGCEDDEELAERTYAGIKRFMEDQEWVVTDRRIFRVEYKHPARYRGKLRTDWDAEVGKPFAFLGEMCIAIFESSSFLVCTPNRGVLKGMPVLIGQPRTVIDFD